MSAQYIIVYTDDQYLATIPSTMSLLKFFEKARSASATTSETAVEAADPQSQPGEPFKSSDLEPDNDSDDDGCDESVPGPPPTKKKAV